jgi:hypothetical protein
MAGKVDPATDGTLPSAHASGVDTPARPARPASPTCKCGESWSRDEWPELPLLGRYQAGRDGWLELRSCVCGATLALSTPEPTD